MNTKEQVTLAEKWAPVLEGIEDEYTRRATAQLLENQAKAIIGERLDEESNSAFTTTVGRLGTFQKFAFPLVRRVYPELIFNKLGGVQPMNGPVSQIFYLGHGRGAGTDANVTKIYSKYHLTYQNFTASYRRQTYISKIGIYDEDRNLIGIAKVATPVKKTEERDFTFKLKLDV